ncbi:MAG: hypothetical protein LUF29_04135 [Oscillospiraceae bacterium]|nr:hypothetical protein [Oscillospiraceae bacterium]
MLDPASESSLTIYGGSAADDAELFADSYTSATTIDIDHQTNSTLDFSYGYLYLKIVSGEPVSMKSGATSYRFIYVNEEYHALIIERNSRRFLVSIPHDVGSDGYCTVCKEYIGGGEEVLPEIVEMDESQYTVTYSMDIDSNSGDWKQWNLGDKELLEALSADGALLQIVRGEEVDSTSVGEEDYEKFVLVDSWYSSNDYVWLGTGGDTSDDEPNVIDCLSDDGITITYDGNAIYDAWMANGLDDGGVAVLVSNCSFTYAVSSIRVIVPAE